MVKISGCGLQIRIGIKMQRGGGHTSNLELKH